MGFKRGFGDKAGRNTANALFNLFGIDFSDRRRVSIDTSRQIKAEARARLDDTRAEIERQNQLFSLDAAVLENVDMVVALPLPTEPDELCAVLSSLLVQLETNSWGLAIDDEKKIRNKYTNAVLSKFKAGVRQLEIIDPNNPRIDDFQSTIRKARWRKFFGAYWFILFFAAPFVALIIGAIFEENPNLWSNYWWVFVVVLIIIVGLIINSAIRRAKKRAARIIAYTKEHSKQPEPESPVAPSTKAQPIVTPSPATVAPEPAPADTHEVIIDAPVVEDKPVELKPQPRSVERPEHKAYEWPITTIQGQTARYSKMWDKYKTIGDIMGRGFAACYIEKQKDILLLGFNPQVGITESDRIYSFPFRFQGYWGDINKMIKSPGLDLKSNTQYLDLFAFRESDQEVAIKEVIQNPALFPYVVEQVSLTQEFIETIVIPRVIVVKDKASWAFLGKLPQFTWMGYSFEHYKDSPYGEVCKITGFTAKKDRINKQIEHTSLEGTRVLFLDPKEEGALVTPQFLESLL